MPRLLLLIGPLFLIQSLVLPQKQSLPSSETDADKVVYLTYNSQFDEALKLTEKYLSKESNSLQWKYFRGMILFRQYKVRMFLSGDRKNDLIKYQTLLDSAVNDFKEVANNGEQILSKNPNDTTALFYAGAAYGYIGMSLASQGENFKAASEGKKGIDYHERLMKLCPQWADVNLSAGLFNYYASNVPWFIKPILWILGKSGSESKAHEYFKIVSEKGRFAKYEALEMQALLYIRQEDSRAANKIIERLTQLFPQSKYYYYYLFSVQYSNNDLNDEADVLLRRAIALSKSESLSENDAATVGLLYYCLAQDYYKRENYYKVIEVWKELIERDILFRFSSWAHLAIGDAYAKLGNKNEALKYYNYVLEKSPIEIHKKIAKEKLAELN